MSFRRLRSPFDKVEWGGVTFKGIDIILINSSSHYGQIVKVGNPYAKTEYTHVFPNPVLMGHIIDATEPVCPKEIRRLRHHFTRRIWMLDGVFECINWQVLNKEPRPKDPKLLPPKMCYNCLSEGNKYIPKQLKSDSIGLCRCCGTPNLKLHQTRLGWPCDLRHKGFCFTVISTGANYTNNMRHYNANFDMSIYSDYIG